MCQCRWEWCLEPYPGRLEAWVYGTHPLIHGPMQIKKVNFDLVFRNKSSPQNRHNLYLSDRVFHRCQVVTCCNFQSETYFIFLNNNIPDKSQCKTCDEKKTVRDFWVCFFFWGTNISKQTYKDRHLHPVVIDHRCCVCCFLRASRNSGCPR